MYFRHHHKFAHLHDAIRSLHREGENAHEIARQLNGNPKSVKNILKKYEEYQPMFVKTYMTNALKNHIELLYRAGYSYTEIVKITGACRSSVYRIKVCRGLSRAA